MAALVVASEKRCRSACGVRASPALAAATLRSLEKGARIEITDAWAVDGENGALFAQLSDGNWIPERHLALDGEIDDACDGEEAALDFHARRDAREARRNAAEESFQRSRNAATRANARAWRYAQRHPCLISAGGCRLPFAEWTAGLGKSDLDRLGDIRRPSPPYRVSVICPTLGRRANYHSFIYECFRAQTWPDKELIVFDDGGDPSPVFRGLDDQRVTYVHVRRLADVTLGAKRTAMQRLASGCIIACFDDDNVYAPTYLEAMVPHLVESGCPTVSLNGAFLYEASSREVWTTRCGVGRGETMVYWRPRHGKANDEWTNVDVGEEGEMHTDKVIHAVDDDFGIFLHVNHANNTGADRLSGAASWDSTDRLKGLGRRIDAGALPNPDLRRLVAAYSARTSS